MKNWKILGVLLIVFALVFSVGCENGTTNVDDGTSQDDGTTDDGTTDDGSTDDGTTDDGTTDDGTTDDGTTDVATIEDFVVTLTDDVSGQGTASAAENGDGSWTISFTGDYGYYGCNITDDASMDLSDYSTVEIDIETTGLTDAQIKLDMSDGSYTSIFNDSNDNWVALNNTRETITYDLSSKTYAAGGSLAAVKQLIFQNDDTGAADYKIHSVTFKE